MWSVIPHQVVSPALGRFMRRVYRAFMLSGPFSWVTFPAYVPIPCSNRLGLPVFGHNLFASNSSANGHLRI